MKILRISLLLNLFSNTKNQSKFLKYINVGLFLSIFAISAAIITFYIETKIDKIESTLAEAHIEQRSNQKIFNYFTKLQSQYKSYESSTSALVDLHEYIASTKLGEYTITVNDLYLPLMFTESEDYDWYKETMSDGVWDEIEATIAEWFGNESEEFKDFSKALKVLKKSEHLFIKDNTEYFEKIFNYDSKKIVNEIRKKESINEWDDEIYKDYVELSNLFRDMLLLLEVMQKLFDEYATSWENQISELNNEILIASNLETKVIVFAFIFQFIVFLIIQYFEISSIKNEKGMNAKRKVK